MQWVSTFAYGASSLGRSRRLEVRPAESGPPSSRGKFGVAGTKRNPAIMFLAERAQEPSRCAACAAHARKAETIKGP